MEFGKLMQGFAAMIGIAELPQEGDTVALEINGIPFGFLHDSATETLIIAADIGQLPESADRPLGSMMLKANFLYEALKGAVIFQNPDNDAFGIQERFRMVDLDVDSLYANVEKLSNIADEWREIVAGYGEAEASATKHQPGHELPSSEFAGNSFLRV